MSTTPTRVFVTREVPRALGRAHAPEVPVRGPAEPGKRAPPDGERPRRNRRGGSLGPVQLLVLGFNDADFRGEMRAELERLRSSDAIRVIDALAVYKDAAGELEVEHLSNLTTAEAIAVGSTIGALIGLAIDGEEPGGGVAETVEDGTSLFPEDDAWDVLAEIPNDSAAALILLEHHWAVPLQEAVLGAGGYRVGDGFICAADLAAIGLLSAAEASEQRLLETAVTAW